MREFYASRPAVAPGNLLGVTGDLERTLDAHPVSAQYFGPASSPAARDSLPLTWVEGQSADPELGGMHILAVSGVEVTPLVLEGQVVGSLVQGPYAAECRLGGLVAPDVTASRPAQARATFERLEQALALAGMDFRHVARTWLYLDDLLSWYGDFNRVRTEFYTERGVFDHLVPASTGIGGGNPAGAAMVAGAYALRATAPGVSVEALPSPLQCPALQYGSSFSRAVEVSMPDLRRVLVSGTASIAPGGETEHVGDVDAQVERTCEVVAAILESRGMGWGDVTRATAYVRQEQDRGAFERYRVAAGLPALPVIVAHNVVCRHDLLFEIEVDAVQAREPSGS
jgi:enamine deaminase RidA (YjgF/YER057c/UK114 family)